MSIATCYRCDGVRAADAAMEAAALREEMSRLTGDREVRFASYSDLKE